MPTRGQGNTGSARWQLKKLLDRPWTEMAACVKHPALPWVADIQPAATTYTQMADICVGCPVFRDCTAYALHGNNGAGADGGFYAGVYIPWQNYNKTTTHSRRQARNILQQRLQPRKV
jgi:hypothetical protein